MARPRKTSPNGFSPKDRRAPDPSGRRRVPLLRARHETTASPRVQMASVLAIVFDTIASPYNQPVPGTGPNPRRHIGMTCVVACPRQPKIQALAWWRPAGPKMTGGVWSPIGRRFGEPGDTPESFARSRPRGGDV